MVVRTTKPRDPRADITAIDTIQCGKDAAAHFSFADGYRNINHGSFGTFPNEIKSVMRHFQDQCESRPDVFIRYEFPERNDEARAAVAKVLGAPTETCVFVPNATTGINTVLRNLVYQSGDVIIFFSTIYGACHKTIEYVCETTPATNRKVEYTYPISDDALCAKFEALLDDIKAQGKKPKVAVFDTIASMPGVRMPFERLVGICRKHSLLSCIDGAHSIGQIPVDVSKLDPDFYVSNCHKWLHVPRGCAVFYVPVRNQHLIRSTLPTSHGFVPKVSGSIGNPLPPSTKSEFVTQFEFTGTLDSSPYLCIPAALQWRSKVVYGDERGEEAIMRYNIDLARDAGIHVAQVLGTEVMDNEQQTLTQCAFANVRLPLTIADAAGGAYDTAVTIAQWISRVLVDEYDTFMAILMHDEKFWVRLSAQIYLTMEDFEWAATVLKEVCDRAKKGEWRTDPKVARL